MWFFNSPQIIFGEDALSWISSFQGKKAFIVTDETMVELRFAQKVQDTLQEAGIESQVFAEIEPDPCLQTVHRCAEAMRAYEPDWIIGLGGGSCMDAAKGAWFLYERPDVDLNAINPLEQFGLRRKARLITIPTTSGTGSDVSWGFALADHDQQCKVVRVSRELIPDVAIVDPGFVLKLPPQVTADSGLDVLCHAIEGYTCNWHNDFTDGLCLKAIELVFKYLPLAYAKGTDQEAREHMHNAATVAGLGFSNTAIILAHTLAHSLAGVFRTVHGRTCALFLPYTIEFLAPNAGQRYQEISHFLHLPARNQAEGVASLVGAIRQLQQELKEPLTLREMGIGLEELKEAMPHLVENVNSSPDMVATPRAPNNQEIEQLFFYAYEGKPIDF